MAQTDIQSKVKWSSVHIAHSTLEKIVGFRYIESDSLAKAEAWGKLFDRTADAYIILHSQLVSRVYQNKNFSKLTDADVTDFKNYLAITTPAQRHADFIKFNHPENEVTEAQEEQYQLFLKNRGIK
jgi:hypothetical protein